MDVADVSGVVPELKRIRTNSQHVRRVDKPPTVLFIVNVAWFFLSHRLPIARAAREAGYEVHVLADVTSPQEIETLEQEGLIFHRAVLKRGGLNPLSDLAYLLRVLLVMRKVSPTLVHNVTVKPVLYGTIAARLLGVRAIINAISGLGYSFTDESRRLLAAVLKRAYRLVLRSPRVNVIFQNRDDAQQLVSLGAVDSRQAILIRGSGVDLLAYHAVAEQRSDRPLVVLPARMLRDKGIVEFAEAARLLSARGCCARFALAGALDPSNPAALSDEELAQLTSDTPLDWLGHVQDMPDLYRSAHIVCLPSYREGLPKALIEACASARPIVTTDVPGCREVVTHNVNGLLVPARDPAALADALQRLIEDPALRAQFGKAGRQKAQEEFDVDSIVRQTMNLYRQAI